MPCSAVWVFIVKYAKVLVVPASVSLFRILTNRPANYVELELSTAIHRIYNTWRTALS